MGWVKGENQLFRVKPAGVARISTKFRLYNVVITNIKIDNERLIRETAKAGCHAHACRGHVKCRKIPRHGHASVAMAPATDR